MRSFLLSKVAIPLHLAFIACYLACVQIRPDGILEYLPLAWFAAGLIEITLLFPSAKSGEEVYDARRRVFTSVRKDPVLILGIVGFLFILFQTLNGPRTISYNSFTSAWEFAEARIRDFPACIDQLLSVQGLFWNILTISAMLAIRNGIGKKGRLLVLKFLVAVSAGLSIYGLATYAPMSPEAGPQPFATFPDPVTAGVYFFIHFCLSCSLFATEMGEAAEKHSGKWIPRLLLLAAVLNFVGTLYSLSCICIAAAVAALLILFVYSAVYLHRRIEPAKKVRMTAVGFILLAVMAYMHFIAYPANRIHERTDKITSGQWVTEEQTAEKQTLTAVAARMFRKNMVHGVGTWGYAIPECFGMYIEDSEWDNLPASEDAPLTCHNDSLQFLAEYGIVGFAILVSPFLLLIFTSLYRLGYEFRPKSKKMEDSTTSSEHETRPFTDRITPNVLALIFAVTVPLVISFKFSIFRYPLIMLTWTVCLSVLSTLLPKPGGKA